MEVISKKQNENITLFGSVGLGMNIIKNTTVISTLETSSTDVDLLVNLNAGVRYSLKPDISAIFIEGSFYQDLTNSASYTYAPLDNLDYLGVNFGFRLTI